MATKLTLAFGPHFYLYQEAHDNAHVYLELAGVVVDVTATRVVMPIPVPVWEVIRRYPGVDLSLPEPRDGDLCREVERQVDERIAAQEAGGFGPPDASREEQIATGLAALRALREQQRRIKQAIAELEALNRRYA